MKKATRLRRADSLSDKHIVLGISGGVAAYKAVELCRRLVADGAQVTPVITHNALRFVGVATFRALATNEPITDLWSDDDPSPHTTLARSADLVVLAPATARIIASLAHGFSDDVLATTLIATKAPIVVCPAMHTEMWENTAVEDNISILRKRGLKIVDPERGELAGGDVGVGRLAGFEAIMSAARSAFVEQDLSGKTVLVTAGGTRERIDPVRFIGNRSSGRQGHAIAEAAAARGAKVVLVTAAASPPNIEEVIRVETAQEMHEAVVAHLDSADVLVMAAAVADFRPVEIAARKIKKSNDVNAIALTRTVDILEDVARRRRDNQVIVGFAAETNDVESFAQEKLTRKGLDLIAANDVTKRGAGFNSSTNSVTIIGTDGKAFATGLVEKSTVAHALLDRVAALL